MLTGARPDLDKRGRRDGVAFASDANARAAKASKKTPPSAEGASTQRTSPLRGYRRVNYSTGAT